MNTRRFAIRRGPAARLRDWAMWAGLIAGAAIVCITIIIFIAPTLASHQFSATLRATQFDGLAPGVDIGILVSALLITQFEFSPFSATLASSFAALPFFIALILRATPQHNSPTKKVALTLFQPLVIVLFLTGYGWSVLGFYSLWRTLSDLPLKPSHAGLPVAGVGIAIATICVPHFQHFIVPLAAALFLVAPQHMLLQHMRIFYALSFTPALMVMGSFAYCQWLYGGTAPLLSGGFLTGPHWGVLGLSALGGLFFIRHAGAAALAVALSSLTVATLLSPTPLMIPLAGLVTAPLALQHRFNAGPIATSVPIVAGAVAVWLLALPLA